MATYPGLLLAVQIHPLAVLLNLNPGNGMHLPHCRPLGPNYAYMVPIVYQPTADPYLSLGVDHRPKHAGCPIVQRLRARRGLDDDGLADRLGGGLC